jgi:plasmid maintenance system antidote protein VapI
MQDIKTKEYAFMRKPHLKAGTKHPLHERRAPRPSPGSHVGAGGAGGSGVSVASGIRRRDMLNFFASQAGHSVDGLALELMIDPARVAELLDGGALISSELATHIEEMLGLPASWLDKGSKDQAISLTPKELGVKDEVESLLPLDNHLPYSSANINRSRAMNRENVRTDQPVSKDQPEYKIPVGKTPVGLTRKQNLILLTERRGTKNTLSQLAGLNGSRISLMTSGRKPVSDPFAHAIEEALELPRGWLDLPRAVDDVPASVWALLSVSPSDTPTDAPETVARAPAAPVLAERPAPIPKPPGTEVRNNNDVIPPSRVVHGRDISIKKSSVLFDKEPGQCGAIAEALVKTIITLSSTDQLSEAKAFQLLGLLIKETEFKA